MATHFFSRSLPKTLTTASRLCRSFSTAPSAASLSTAASPSRSLFHCLRPLAGAIASASRLSPAAVRSLSTNATTSSLRDPNPNWSNRPPKETILLDGCDFQHWLVVMEPPDGDLTRDEIIDGFIKTLAMVVGSEEEARKKIYSVSHKCYFAFGALVDEETSIKIKELPKVRWVLPDSYLDVRNKDYGGEPFINGEAVPYDPKYHEEWIRNNSRANERNRRNDRPRNFDRSRNFDRRRENMQNRDFQNRPPVQNAGPDNMAPPQPRNVGPPPPGNMGPPPPGNMGPPPPGNMGPPDSRNMPPRSNMGPGNNYNNVQPSNNWNGGQPSYNQGPPNGGQPSNNWNGGQPSNNWNGGQPNYTQGPPNGVRPDYNQRPPNNYNQTPPQGNYNNIKGPANNMGVAPQDNMGGRQLNAEWGAPGQNQNNYTPERDDGGIPGTNRY